jgi:hypothetical protein
VRLPVAGLKYANCWTNLPIKAQGRPYPNVFYGVEGRYDSTSALFNTSTGVARPFFCAICFTDSPSPTCIPLRWSLSNSVSEDNPNCPAISAMLLLPIPVPAKASSTDLEVNSLMSGPAGTTSSPLMTRYRSSGERSFSRAISTSIRSGDTPSQPALDQHLCCRAYRDIGLLAKRCQ